MTGRTRAGAAPLERTEQALFVRRIRLDPRTKHLMFTATANGMAARSKVTAAKMIGQGLSRGVPDLLFFERNRYGRVGLAIEMKRRPNKPTDEQREWLSGLEARDWTAAVCYSAEEAWTVLCDYFDINP